MRMKPTLQWLKPTTVVSTSCQLQEGGEAKGNRLSTPLDFRPLTFDFPLSTFDFRL